MSGLMVDIDILVKLISQYYPDIIDHMEENNFLDYFRNILFQWFISLFINNFDEEVNNFFSDKFFKKNFLLKNILVFPFNLGYFTNR